MKYGIATGQRNYRGNIAIAMTAGFRFIERLI